MAGVIVILQDREDTSADLEQEVSKFNSTN